MIRYAREKGPVNARWINALLEKKPPRLVSVAVANKTARIAWVLLVRKEDYRAPMPVERSAQTRPKDGKVIQGRVDYGVMQAGRERGLNKPEALSEHQVRQCEWVNSRTSSGPAVIGAGHMGRTNDCTRPNCTNAH